MAKINKMYIYTIVLYLYHLNFAKPAKNVYTSIYFTTAAATDTTQTEETEKEEYVKLFEILQFHNL